MPSSQMKMGREHKVPLSSAAVSVLHKANAQRDVGGLVFPSVMGQEPSDSTQSKLLPEQGPA
ncbi:hypothetical protein A9Q94_19345 [Rhodobacterales bacterium 56_14_T64]|nr:hypothetical protein A9Q94_19345 [Rhodobacterales bacterium 56_14_T64]